jgi:hypothetical protein
MFNATDYFKRLTEAGLPEPQAKVMVDMMKDIDNMVNPPKDKEKEDGDNEV